MHVLEPGSPGTRIGSPGFRGCRGGAEEGRLRDSQRLVLRPLPRPGCGRPHRKMQANQSPGAGPRPSRPPSGLIESYIKKFSSERGERGEGEGEGAEEKGKRESMRARKERLESLRHERDNRLGICRTTVTRESSQRITITPTLTFPTRS